MNESRLRLVFAVCVAGMTCGSVTAGQTVGQEPGKTPGQKPAQTPGQKSDQSPGQKADQTPGRGPAPAPDVPGIPEGESEASLIEKIKRFAHPQRAGLSGKRPLAGQVAVKTQTLVYIDALLTRYPETFFKEDALIAKLSVLADLARIHPMYLEQFLSVTAEIDRGKPGERLAAENAFFAIQAFVLGARVEKMPESRRLLGTRERYEAFLGDHPKSPRVPVVSASLIRNLIALEEVDRARAVFDSLKRTHPDDKATRRAQGELYRAVAVGQPFAFSYATADGKTLNTTEYLGKVLVVHFWATWSEPSMSQLPELIDLFSEYGEQGLQLLGVNLDYKQAGIDEALQTHNMPWPQYLDLKGFENDILVATGVVTIPTVFVVDRKGTLRAINSGDGLRDLVKSLLSED